MRATLATVGVAATVLSVIPAHAQQRATNNGEIQNGEFEQGAIGQTPPGWFVGASLPEGGEARSVYAAQVTGLMPGRGWYCACLYTTDTPVPGQFGTLAQSISAKAVRGTTLRFAAQLRVDMARNAKGGANLFVRVDRRDGPPLLLTEMEKMGGKLASKRDWRQYEIAVSIPKDAETIHFGVILIGEGRVYVDSLAMEANGAPVAGVRIPSRVAEIPPTTEDGVIGAIEPIESAINAKPGGDGNNVSARVATAAPIPAKPTATRTPARTVKVRALPNANFEKGKVGQMPPGWFVPPAVRKVGFGAKIVEGGPNVGNKCAMLYRNPKAKTPNSSRLFANMMQTLDAAPFRGKRISYRAWARVLGKSAKDHAQMWLRIDRTDGSVAFLDMMTNKQIRDKTWRQYEIVGDVPADARTINFGVIFLRDGKAFVDNVGLKIVGNAKVQVARQPSPTTAQQAAAAGTTPLNEGGQN